MPINDPEKSENMRKSIRVYSGSSNRPLAQKIAEYLGVELSGLTLKQFATVRFTPATTRPSAAPTSS